MLKDFRPPYDATVIARLKAAGAVLFGKTNMDEFAMGSSTENSAYGPTRNPWDEARIPGGSSGGSAAAVAADLAPLALGSDTGGSIRQPAVGLRGRRAEADLRPREPLRPDRLRQLARPGRPVRPRPRRHRAPAQGHPGPRPAWTRRASTRPSPTTRRPSTRPPNPLRIGIVPEFFGEGLDPEVEAAVREAVKVYEAAGATVKEVSLPHSKYGVPAYYIVAPAECSSNLARYDGTIYGHRAEDFSPKYPGEEDIAPLVRMMMASRAEGFGAEVKRRIMLGTFALSAGYADQYYNQALKVRRLIRNDFDAAFKRGGRAARPDLADGRVQARREDEPTRWRCTCRTSTRSRRTSRASPA